MDMFFWYQIVCYSKGFFYYQRPVTNSKEYDCTESIEERGLVLFRWNWPDQIIVVCA
jgi:hypothetical protein